MSVPPGRLFWSWSLRSVVRAAVLGVVLGGSWTLLAIRTTGTADTRTAALMAGLSYLLDSTFVYVTVMIATIIGMALQTWDVVAAVIQEERALLFRRYLWAMLLALTIGTLSRRFTLTLGTAYDSMAVVLLNMVVVSTVAFGAAYQAYCISCVLRRGERTEYLAERSEASLVHKLMSTFLPWHDRNRVWLPALHATLISVVSFLVSYNVVGLGSGGSARTFPVWYSATSMLLFTLWGVIRRLIDAVKPGVRERLYPYFENVR